MTHYPFRSWAEVTSCDRRELVTIEAESASDAKTKLAEMRNNDLVKSSSIWQSEEPVSIDCVETDLGLMDIKEWELVYGS